jgi:hypothetical protein
MAEVNENASGANISFRTYRSCTITSQTLEITITNRVITVDGQKIQAAYVCTEAADAPSKTQEIYVTKTSEGQEFIRHKFLNKQFVFVRLADDLEVPFSTKGFPELWNRVNRPAL